MAKPEYAIREVSLTYPDHIIVDIPEISKHCWFENDFNMDCVYPEYNFQE